MYTLFMQKRKGDDSPFVLTKQLHDFVKHTNATGIFISPGHLSRNPKNIEDLLDVLISLKDVEAIGIGNKYRSTSLTLYEDHLRKNGKLWEVDRNGNSDHRKMVFVLKYKDPLPKLERTQVGTILSQIEVIGVVIGSSNFSYQSYGPITPGTLHADKGEADIMMFTDDAFAKKLANTIGRESDNPQFQPQMVLSKSVTAVPHNFLKKIFEETLEITLN